MYGATQMANWRKEVTSRLKFESCTGDKVGRGGPSLALMDLRAHHPCT